MPVLSAHECVLVRVCLCVCVCKGLGFDSSTFGSSVDLGSAQMSLHSQVPQCVTLFPVTFSAINLQTYSDGAPLWGYIVLVCHTIFWMVRGVVRALVC